MKTQMPQKQLRVRTQMTAGFDNQFDCGEGCDNACRWEKFAFKPGFFKLRNQMTPDELGILNDCSNACYDKSCKNIRN